MRTAMIFTIILLMSAIWSSCRTIKYVPVETVRYDSIYFNRVTTDSIYERDSIYILDRGDTVIVYRNRYIYRYINKTDTVYRLKVDSVQVPYEVEKQLTRWEQMKMDFGGWVLGVLIALIILFVIKWKRII